MTRPFISSLFTAIAFCLAPSITRAAPPPLLPVQGYLTDDSDAPLSGIYKVTFTLNDAESGGTSLFTTTEAVVVTKGRFTTYLGDKQQLALDKLHRANAVWLEITIVQSCGSDVSCASPTSVNKTLTPRVQLASTAFAASAAYCSVADNVPPPNATTQAAPSAPADQAAGLPGGMISMFASSCPSGWALCDGSQGTPNLVGSYVKGGTSASPATGSNSHTHALGGQTAPAGSHHHFAMVDWSPMNALWLHWENVDGSQTDRGWTSTTRFDVTGTGHSDESYKESGGTLTTGVPDHTHALSGMAEAVNHEPQHATLVYCMKK